MVHAREVRPLRFREGVTAVQLLDVVRRRAGFGDGNVQTAEGKSLLHTEQPVPTGHYFFTPWSAAKDKLGATAGLITVRVRGGGVQPARFPVGTTGKQLLEVLRGLPDFGDGTCDDMEGFAVPPSNEQLAPGSYFFLPGLKEPGAQLIDIAATGSRNSPDLPVVIRAPTATMSPLKSFLAAF